MNLDLAAAGSLDNLFSYRGTGTAILTGGELGQVRLLGLLSEVLDFTALRFFTVYGPWGRPDMSPIGFAHAIVRGEPIKVFNHGKMRRDFTYIDDIVEGVVRTLALPPQPSVSGARHALYNIGNHEAVGLEDYIDTLAKALGRPVRKDYQPMQPGDVPATYADTSRLQALTGFMPSTPLAAGIARFVEWYEDYYRVRSG